MRKIGFGDLTLELKIPFFVFYGLLGIYLFFAVLTLTIYFIGG